MKLNIIQEESQRIENYNNVLIENGVASFLNVSDGECEEVLALHVNALHFPSLIECLNKVAVGGKIKLSGVDLPVFCRQVTNRLIKEEHASNLIEASKTIVPIKVITNTLNSMGFEVETALIRGVNYEICANRK